MDVRPFVDPEQPDVIYTEVLFETRETSQQLHLMHWYMRRPEAYRHDLLPTHFVIAGEITVEKVLRDIVEQLSFEADKTRRLKDKADKVARQPAVVITAQQYL